MGVSASDEVACGALHVVTTVEIRGTAGDLLHRTLARGTAELRAACDAAERTLPWFVWHELERYAACGDPEEVRVAALPVRRPPPVGASVRPSEGGIANTVRFRHRQSSWRSTPEDAGVGPGLAQAYLEREVGEQLSLVGDGVA